ncbi:MAG: hypothetical protein OXC46_05355 [Thaumarchaeota archaeon]|nr:hypothetical protein [Nitrososphaerota archaeon]
MRKELNDDELTLEKIVNCTWKRAMYDVVYDKRTIDPNLSKLDILWHEIDEEAAKWKNNDLRKLCNNVVKHSTIRCKSEQRNLLKSLYKPRLDCCKVLDNFEMVYDCFVELVTKNKNSKQVVAHIKSEKGGHSHYPDKLILAQGVTCKKLVDDPESKDYIPNCKIYIASNDKKFFSSYNEDGTITNVIRVMFKIICDSPEKIVDRVK